jgi:hypothetical protein
LFTNAGFEAVAEAEGAIPEGVEFEAELRGETLPVLNADRLVSLVVGEQEVPLVRFPGGEAGFEGGVVAFDLGVGGRGREVGEGLESMAANTFFFEEIAGDTVEEGGNAVDDFAFVEAAGEAGEGVVG